MFKAIMLTKSENATRAEIIELRDSDLPKNNVTIKIAYSSLNYKDALAITGASPVIRSWPMVPGIDFAGIVVESETPEFRRGDKVIANGWGIGEVRWGGLAQMARVPASFLTPLPSGLTLKQAMSIGTAGYTAMLCIDALHDQGVGPEQGEVLVTGANGGVGSFSIGILARKGFTISAVTGRPEEAERLRILGANEIIEREVFSLPGKSLQKERWRAAIDSVGSQTLVNVCASMKYNGVVCCCGLAQGMDFSGSVAPFILRGVALIGIDSVQASLERRQRAWSGLAALADEDLISSIAHEIALSDVIALAPALLAGKIKGRVVVNVGE